MVNSGYQKQDTNIFDYKLWKLPNSPLHIRGPRIELQKNKYLVAIGAAQTFGRFANITYCDMLSKQIDMPILNFGFSGAGPTFFSENETLLELINDSSGVIVQMLSGRSVSNSRFVVQGNQGLVKPAHDPKADPVFAETAYLKFLQKASATEKAQLLAEIRLRYVAAMARLLGLVKPPKLLMYWSTREPRYREGLANLQGYWAAFPHFVDAGVCEALRPHADDYIEIVTKRGLPQPLVDKSTGKPVLMWPESTFPNVALRYHNLYYPSPEMHEDAAKALTAKLAQPLRKVIAPRRRDVLLHVHIFKNAGSSIDRLLRSFFRAQWKPVDPKEPGDCFLEKDILTFLQENEDISAISTHQFRFPLTDAGHIHFHPLVMLRHPIDRAFSVYNFERTPARQVSNTSWLATKAASTTFAEFIEWCLSAPGRGAPILNYQTRYLSQRFNGKTYSDWVQLPNVVNLREAMSTFEKVPAVGIVDEFAVSAKRFNDILSPTFGQIAFQDVIVNRTKQSEEHLPEAVKKIADLLRPALYERLVGANALDLELYNFGRRRLGLSDLL
jgi:hypothetical protein